MSELLTLIEYKQDTSFNFDIDHARGAIKIENGEKSVALTSADLVEIKKYYTQDLAYSLGFFFHQLGLNTIKQNNSDTPNITMINKDQHTGLITVTIKAQVFVQTDHPNDTAELMLDHLKDECISTTKFVLTEKGFELESMILTTTPSLLSHIEMNFPLSPLETALRDITEQWQLYKKEKEAQLTALVIASNPFFSKDLLSNFNDLFDSSEFRYLKSIDNRFAVLQDKWQCVDQQILKNLTSDLAPEEKFSAYKMATIVDGSKKDTPSQAAKNIKILSKKNDSHFKTAIKCIATALFTLTVLPGLISLSIYFKTGKSLWSVEGKRTVDRIDHTIVKKLNSRKL